MLKSYSKALLQAAAVMHWTTGRPRRSSVEKAKMELLTKHGSSQNDPSREIQQYRYLSVSAVDPLEWWRTQTEAYRRLSHLARAVLAIPATSAPSERIFFTRWCGAKLQTKLIVTTRR